MLPKSLDTIRIDINSGQVRKSVSINQNDTSQRTLNFFLVDGGKPVDISDLLFAEILIQKADGYEVDNGCVIDGNSIQYTLRSNDIAALGKNIGQLMLTFESGQVLTTPTFEIVVYAKVLNQQVQVSTNEYQGLTQQLVLVNELSSQVAIDKSEADVSAQSAAASASEAATYLDTVSMYESQAGFHATIASEYAHAAASEADNANSEAIAASEYAYSASVFESEIASEISVVGDYKASTSEYMLSASEYASAAGSDAIRTSNNVIEATSLLNDTSEYASAAASEASVASSCAIEAENWADKAEEAYEKMGEESLVLGETSSTAYRGDRGKIAYDHSQTTGNPHNTTAAQVGADPTGSAAAAYQQAAGYVDQAIANLINGAPTTLDTLKEIADAMAEYHDVVEALDDAIGTKANETDFEGHRTNDTIHITANERTAWNAKQNATDNNLITTAKTVVGAINELDGEVGDVKSALTNLDITEATFTPDWTSWIANGGTAPTTINSVIRKSGHVIDVYISMIGITMPTNEDLYAIGNISSNYRPSVNVRVPVLFENLEIGYCVIRTSGQIQFSVGTNETGQTTNLEINDTYIN